MGFMSDKLTEIIGIIVFGAKQSPSNCHVLEKQEKEVGTN